MDISGLIRDGTKTNKSLVRKGDTVVAKDDLKIYIPASYEGTPLAVIEDEIRIVGIFGIVVGNHYGLSRACCLLRIAPSDMNRVEIEGEMFLEFAFYKGDVVISNVHAVRSKILLFRIFKELFSKGNVPWYMDKDDHSQTFDTAVLHGGGYIGRSFIIELMAMASARNPLNKQEFFRHTVKSMKEKGALRPAFIPLNSVGYGATNTSSKLLGNHFGEGVTSALTVTSKEQERLEEILRL